MWELIEQAPVYYEKDEELNSKIELESTGSAKPNAKSEQDGENKDGFRYKVRYQYAPLKETIRDGKSVTRDFCSKMIDAKKIYRKEDIMAMSSKSVNPGWGPRGANTYDVWLYKGGGNCHHFWLRQIYKTSLRGAKSKIKPSEAISYTKALSEGFTAERNDTLVARPPKRMKNEGFLEPR